jgi:hypothetical protein
VTSAPAARMNDVASKIVEVICRKGMRSREEWLVGCCCGIMVRV